MKTVRLIWSAVASGIALAAGSIPVSAQQVNKPNILVIMADDIGWSNVGAYNQGLMYDTTPNLDQMAKEGMRFTDYYAEASCTAGRANFITGEIPIRTGMTTVGQAGSAIGFPDAAPTIANALHAQGYATGQFEIIAMGAALPCPRYDTRYVPDELPETLAAQPRASYCVRR